MIFLYHEVAFRQHESNFLIRYILWKVVGKTHLVPITVLNACFPTTCVIKLYKHSTTKRKQNQRTLQMGPEDPSNQEKKYPSFFKPNFRKLHDDSRKVSLKIGSSVPHKLGPFFSLFLMRKTHSSGQSGF